MINDGRRQWDTQSKVDETLRGLLSGSVGDHGVGISQGKRRNGGKSPPRFFSCFHPQNPEATTEVPTIVMHV